jgi:hypothetical protein
MSTMWLGTRVRAPILIVIGCLLGRWVVLRCDVSEPLTHQQYCDAVVRCRTRRDQLLGLSIHPPDTGSMGDQFVRLASNPASLKAHFHSMVCLGNVMISNLVEQ